MRWLKMTNDLDSFVLIPYFARVEYIERFVRVRLREGWSSMSVGPSASSRLCMTWSSLRYRYSSVSRSILICATKQTLVALIEDVDAIDESVCMFDAYFWTTATAILINHNRQ